MRCPTCRATLNDTEVCRRCGTDISFVLAAERKGIQMESLAVKLLAAGDTQKALDAANQALTFKRTDRAVVIKNFVTIQVSPFGKGGLRGIL